LYAHAGQALLEDADGLGANRWSRPVSVDTQEEASLGAMERRKRRAFTREFKAETIRLVVEGGRSIP
jgi:hypothetical protein